MNEFGNSGFATSRPNSLGIELELQLIDPLTGDLTPKAQELIGSLSKGSGVATFKPEITAEMIEINSGVHMDPRMLLEEMFDLRSNLLSGASELGIGLSGGGVHPTSNWPDLHISRTAWCEYLQVKYGYLAFVNSVFGLHIHIGVANGDEAIRLVRNLMPFVPHLIALSASSPYKCSADTAYNSSRLHGFRCVPTVGYMPHTISNYRDFKSHISDLVSHKVIANQKELYWDIRPKEEFGTVEIRVCDAPLTILRACQIAAFCQALSVAIKGREYPNAMQNWIYEENLFQACRHGLNAAHIMPNGVRVDLRDDLHRLYDEILPISRDLGSHQMLSDLFADIKTMGNDSEWLRRQYLKTGSYKSIIQSAVQLFGC